MNNIFTSHPKSMNETYCQHFFCAVKFGSKMFIGAIVCFVHALLPFLFKKTGSNLLFGMVHDYVNRAPTAEERIVGLSETIEKKFTQC